MLDPAGRAKRIAIEDLKLALNIHDLRNTSGDKVLDLIRLVQSDQIGEAALAALLVTAPETISKLVQVMDDSFHRAVASSDRSSDKAIYDNFGKMKNILEQVISDPNSSENKSLTCPQ
ncbi:Hypothetical protein Cp262_2112 [Corynebacterium pseudotuberculosis]|uniref:hypothetical protein n=1 Tax=Corynebacterium pseudotuberculosis TaxID=1719 RepID=UPI000B42C381|nr:hypothetical protein [Corynebacterium pseudotuberculosis]ARX64213.1 Hypothetical protein Cp262_2112 [Corynebacterium pseudotuberculosis]